MEVNYYLEFFVESLIDFYKNKHKKNRFNLPISILNSRITLKSFYTNERYCLDINKIFEVLDIPYRYTLMDENPDISLNFLQNYIMQDTKVHNCHVNLQFRSVIDLRKVAIGFPNSIMKSQEDIEYIISVQNKNLPFIITYNAYNVDTTIWENIYRNLYEQFNFIIFNGNYGSLFESAYKINTILESECINRQGIALAWCSGFKVFAHFNKKYPGWFTQLYVVTGNYFNINGAGQLSDFEKSTLSLISLVDCENMLNIEKIFMYFFSKQTIKPFGIPDDVWPLVSARFSDIDYFIAYLNSMKELSLYDLSDSLKSIDFPVTNIIASNDVISMLSNNELVDKEIGNCNHIMLNFATHWCLWTHANQIAEIIKFGSANRFMKKQGKNLPN